MASAPAFNYLCPARKGPGPQLRGVEVRQYAVRFKGGKGNARVDHSRQAAGDQLED